MAFIINVLIMIVILSIRGLAAAIRELAPRAMLRSEASAREEKGEGG